VAAHVKKKAPPKVTKQDVNCPTQADTGSSKSERSREDAAAASGLGVGTTDSGTRVLAAMGMIDQAPSEFLHCQDVSFGGVLFALPALLACGLLRHGSRFFTLPAGFYSLTHILTLLAFMALCRIRSIEDLRYTAPGEWGKLLGLDRCPEVKTLREKLKILVTGKPEDWAAQLSKDWMQEDVANVGTLYIDGHTRVYHGHQTKLPRRYVARQRLCLRATTDYWVNGLEGLPFFKINCAVDPGMIKVIEEQIVPTLETQIPDQPTEEQLQTDPLRTRFRLVFDREGYSPGLFKRMNAKHIACQTYHKHPAKEWSRQEFHDHTVTLVEGGEVQMLLAERGTLIGSKSKDKIWVREIRKWTDSGRQISIISTQWQASVQEIVGPQFGRWSQENFFKYGRQHFNLDGLIDYQLEPIDETTQMVNPAWRKLDGEIRRAVAHQNRRKAKLHELDLKGQLTTKGAKRYMGRAETLRQEIETQAAEIERQKSQRRDAGKHVSYGDLPKEEQFLKLATRSKHFIDTLKIVAYRAETAMARVVREHLGKHHQDEARAYVRDLYTSEANLIPDMEAKTLTVELHSLATPKANEIISHLCVELNATETNYPDTELKLIFKSVSD
jgi:hypothetical protein